MTEQNKKEFCYLIATSGLFRDIFLLENLLATGASTEKVIKKMKFYEKGKLELISRTVLQDLIKEKEPEKIDMERKRWKSYLNILDDIDKHSNDERCKIEFFFLHKIFFFCFPLKKIYL